MTTQTTSPPPVDPQQHAARTLTDIEIATAEAWDAADHWDYERLRRALDDIAVHVDAWKAGPLSRVVPDPAPAREICPNCGSSDGRHGVVHTRHGNGGGSNHPCPRTPAAEE